MYNMPTSAFTKFIFLTYADFFFNKKVELVKKEMAWESEKHQVVLDKIKKR